MSNYNNPDHVNYVPDKITPFLELTWLNMSTLVNERNALRKELADQKARYEQGNAVLNNEIQTYMRRYNEANALWHQKSEDYNQLYNVSWEQQKEIKRLKRLKKRIRKLKAALYDQEHNLVDNPSVQVSTTGFTEQEKHERNIGS